MPTPEMKAMIASVETSGNVEGNYAQLEDIVLRDLKMHRGLPKDITLKQVKGNPILYDKVVDMYLNRMEDFGVTKDTDKALWLLMPTRYRKTGGDISKVPGKELRNIMGNRVKNLSAHLKSRVSNTNPYSEELSNGSTN